jgi:hypothetical protein
MSANDAVKDASGTEVGLRWGIGRVRSVTTPAGKRNGRVEFVQDGFKHASAGSVEIRRQADLITALRATEGQDVYWAFRLETHRDEKVDKAVPFATLAAADDNTSTLHSRLIAAYPDGSPEAKALIAECEAQAAAGSLAAVAVPAAPAPPPVALVANQPEPNQLPGDSWEFAAKDGCVALAFEQWEQARQGGHVERYGRDDIKKLADAFLHIADYAQSAFSGRLDRASRCHTRARGLLRTVLLRDKAPFGNEDGAAWAKWERKVAATTLALLQIADEIGRPGAPAAAAA